jgi:hypothetical protein
LQQGLDVAGRPLEQPPAGILIRGAPAGLEELDRDAEREVDLEVVPMSADHLHVGLPGEVAGGVQEARFPLSGRRLDEDDAAYTLTGFRQYLLDAGQLGLTFDERPREASIAASTS